MIIDVSHTWPGKASLVQTKKGFVIIHLREFPYNKFETELWDADKNGVALLSNATLYEGSDVFDEWVKKYEFKPRKSKEKISKKREAKNPSAAELVDIQPMTKETDVEFKVDFVKVEDEPLILDPPHTGSEDAIVIDANKDEAPFIGKIKDIKSFDRVLSELEISEHATASLQHNDLVDSVSGELTNYARGTYGHDDKYTSTSTKK